MSKRPSYRAGFATRDITHLEPGALLMGWAIDSNRATGIGTRLLARAMVVVDATGEAVAYACAELAFVDVYLREKVVERLAHSCASLRLGDHNIMLSATHTHSGPAGASPYLLYNISNPGFSQPLFDHLVDGLAGAIEDAAAALTPAHLRLTTVEIPASEPVAFNRSLEAYNRNPDVVLRRPHETHLAVDRTMTLLLATSTKGKPLGSLNWFGVHNTSVHFDQGLLHHDNKGVAAALHEAEMRAQNPDFVSINLGMNDCGGGEKNLPNFKAKMREMVKKTREMKAVPVLHVPNPVVAGNGRAKDLPAYCDAIRELAKAESVLLVDHQTVFAEKSGTANTAPKAWMNDAIHPNGVGQAEMAKAMFRDLGLFDPKSPVCKMGDK